MSRFFVQYIDVDLDYSGCCYEGETPETILKAQGKPVEFPSRELAESAAGGQDVVIEIPS